MFNFQDTKPVRTQSENRSSNQGVSPPSLEELSFSQRVPGVFNYQDTKGLSCP